MAEQTADKVVKFTDATHFDVTKDYTLDELIKALSSGNAKMWPVDTMWAIGQAMAILRQANLPTERILAQIGQVGDFATNLGSETQTITPALKSIGYVYFQTGELLPHDTAEYETTDFIEISAGVTKVITSFQFNTAGTAGWAIYDADKKFIRGGQTAVISDVQVNERYIRLTDFDASQAHENRDVNFIYRLGEIRDLVAGSVTQSLGDFTQNAYINSDSGAVNIFSESVGASQKIRIPDNTISISTTAQTYPFGPAGWAMYDDRQVYVTGGKLSKINVIPENALYIAFTNVGGGSSTVTFNFDHHNGDATDTANLARKIITVNPSLSRAWVGKDGQSGRMNNDEYFASNYLIIPKNTSLIKLNCRYNPAVNGAGGWQIVDSSGAYVRWGQTNYIEVQPGDFAIAVTDWDSNGKHDGITVSYTIGALSENTDSPLAGKKIAFLGDSITYGFDPTQQAPRLAHPWASQVADKLGMVLTNYGVNSATVVPVEPIAKRPTPMIEKYDEMDADEDFVIVMGGINDAYNMVPLGKMTDRDDTTFYGGLHMLYKALAQKYPAKDGRHVLVMTYPRYDMLPAIRDDATFDEFMAATREVAGYYALPVIDMYDELGISPYSDDAGEYWIKMVNNTPTNGLHNPHPTQLGANVIGEFIAQYLAGHYGLSNDTSAIS